jgi:hypothetical protein
VQIILTVAAGMDYQEWEAVLFLHTLPILPQKYFPSAACLVLAWA